MTASGWGHSPSLPDSSHVYVPEEELEVMGYG